VNISTFFLHIWSYLNIIKHFEENVENVDEIRVLDLQKFEQKLGNYNTTIGNCDKSIMKEKFKIPKG
jgi:hypothetical protein